MLLPGARAKGRGIDRLQAGAMGDLEVVEFTTGFC